MVTGLTLTILLTDTKYTATLNNVIKSTKAKPSVIMYTINNYYYTSSNGTNLEISGFILMVTLWVFITELS